jgi:large subunit ribosomal protein L30
MLKITLVKSKIGNTPANRATIKALGLNKISSSNTFEDNAVVRGMIHKVKHLIKVEEIEGGTVTRRRQDGKAASEKRANKAAGKSTAAKPKTAAEMKPAKKAAVAPAKKEAAPKATAKKTTAEDKPKRTTKKKSDEA